GTCLNCRLTAGGHLSQPDQDEQTRLSPRELASGVRLACQTRIFGDAFIILPSFGGAAVHWESDSEMPHTPSPGLGLAVDLGTTTCAFVLTDLESGTILNRTSVLNPQVAFGQDVLTRISRVDEQPETLHTLHTQLTEAIDTQAHFLCEQTGRSSRDIHSIVCVGNTIILHFLARYNPTSIGRYPYTPQTLFGTEYPASHFSFHHIPNATVYIPPCINGYIGADITAGLLIPEINKEPFVFLDLGTNGEIAYYSPASGFSFVSAAAGPAFEGGGIEKGMTALEGAITGAKRHRGQWELTVLGGNKATGICGSGLMDVVACLMEEERITPEGRLVRRGDANDPVIECGEKLLCILEESVYLTQQDIYHCMLAKAAIAAAIDFVMKDRKADTLYLAGGWGKYMQISSARLLGLFGSHSFQTIRPLGNTALGGALTLLVSPKSREILRTCRDNSVCMESAGDHEYSELLVHHMQLRR
ncbi:MAG TPA: hypothetical protein DER23_01625, partial [Clostridiales bacterium]|nr:hypothetical protein [Clostridiales bacterium]